MVVVGEEVGIVFEYGFFKVRYYDGDGFVEVWLMYDVDLLGSWVVCKNVGD